MRSGKLNAVILRAASFAARRAYELSASTTAVNGAHKVLQRKGRASG